MDDLLTAEDNACDRDAMVGARTGTGGQTEERAEERK
jgi:hypothetical protein